MAAADGKVSLQDAERARIRNSSTKRGFLSVFEFYPGPRGGRFRNARTRAFTTLAERERETKETRSHYLTPVRAVRTYEVDHLGRVQREVSP